MKPKELISKLAKVIERPPPPPPPTPFQEQGGWNNARASAGGAVSHLSPDESRAAKIAGADALVQLMAQKDAKPGGQVHDIHILP